MLEKPPIPDEEILAGLSLAFGLDVNRLEFLPLGADVHTAVYRAQGPAGEDVFAKLRTGNFDPAGLEIPRYLNESGITVVMAPLATRSGALFHTHERYRLMAYPYVIGKDGYETSLSLAQWESISTALRQIHRLALPQRLRKMVRRETFGGSYRRLLAGYQARVEAAGPVDDPLAQEMANVMRSEAQTIRFILKRTRALARSIRAARLPFVLCHTDLHQGNLLIAENGKVFIVDWDAPLLAPKERDLMHFGSSLGWYGPDGMNDGDLFYHGYGRDTHPVPEALTYYRYERIIVDLVEFYEQISLKPGPDSDRAQGLQYFLTNFGPKGIIENAKKSDPELQK